MTKALFDGYLMVDWSAAGTRKTGADSIWLAWLPQSGRVTLENPATRLAAMVRIRDILATAQGRVLAGFDFAFGYPSGTARALTGQDDWRGLWALIADVVSEGDGNGNNRFDAAAALNAKMGGDGPFWGNGMKRDIVGLPRLRPQGYGVKWPAQKRHAETIARGAQEVWKLNGAGSVGGQALTGIALLEGLRRDLDVRVWPFEAHDLGGHVLAEIYPSLVPPHPDEAVKDAGQVRAFAETIARLDRAGELAALMAAPAKMPPEVCREEAVMLGAGMLDLSPPAARIGHKIRYEHDPKAIYRQSFATVRSEARLERFDVGMASMAVRLIHACGMVEVADRLAFSPGAITAGRAALLAGAPVICDCEMAAAGVIRRYLPAGNDVLVTLNDPRVPARAAAIGNTRSAAAVELWRDRIEGAVVAIGNAPTALFHLLELLDQGWPKPAVILGFPVGFVGAAESKAALAANARGCEFVALRGRRGGSAMASAAVNALAAGLPEERE
jgi:precorrin-8X/cobalt-precorrin-8 methylmutase